MTTLWEKWTGSTPPAPKSVAVVPGWKNLLRLHPGSFVCTHDPDEQGRIYTVITIRDVRRILAGQDFWFTDYFLNEKDEWRVLRVIQDGADLQRLWLTTPFEGEYDKGIEDAAKCRIFHADWENGVHEDFDAGQSGVLGYVGHYCVSQANCPDKLGEIRYWDFLGKEQEVLLFVEIEQTTGWITMYRGLPIMELDLETY